MAWQRAIAKETAHVDVSIVSFYCGARVDAEPVAFLGTY